MAELYADEQFPTVVVEKLRNREHDVLTVQDAGKRGDSEEQVLEFATQQERAVLTINRRDFIRLHQQRNAHAGIIVCKQDHDWQRLAINIDRAIIENAPLRGKLVRVRRES